MIETQVEAYPFNMSEERNPASLERYSSKLVRQAARSTWRFSKAQFIVDGILAIVSVPIGYAFGLVTSVGSAILAVRGV